MINKKKNILFALLVMIMSAVTGTLFADVVVITNRTTDIDSLTAKEVKLLYLQKKKTFPNGVVAIVGDQPSDSDVRDEFNKKVLKKSSKKIKRYWSKRIFSGKGVPPKVIGKDEEMKKWVANTPNSLGYIDAKSLDNSVKVILRP